MGAAGGGLHQGGHWPARRSHRQFTGRAHSPDRSCARAIDGVGCCGCSTAGSSLDHAGLPSPSSSATTLESLAASQRLRAASPGASASVDHPDSLLKTGLQGAYSRSISHDRALLRSIQRPAIRPTAARALRAMCVGMGLRPHGATAPALLQRLRQPILLVWGLQDRFVPYRLGQQVQQTHPAVDLMAIDGCGHCPHDECCESFLELLLPGWTVTWVKDDQQGPTSGDETHPFGRRRGRSGALSRIAGLFARRGSTLTAWLSDLQSRGSVPTDHGCRGR